MPVRRTPAGNVDAGSSHLAPGTPERVRALFAAVEPYEGALLLAGVVALAAAWVPVYVDRRPLSLPIVLVAIGMAVYALPLGLPLPDPLEHAEATERLTELGVLVALTGAGLGIDRPIGWRRWGSAWRLLAVAMPICIAATAVVGVAVLGLGLAGAVLLGAALAPTDPVLAADVQVGEPTVAPAEDAVDDDAADADPLDDPDDEARGVLDAAPPSVTASQDREAEEREAAAVRTVEENEDEVRVALTAEAGLNDGLAFPFVMLAIALAGAGSTGEWLPRWLLWDVAGRVAIGLVLGVAVGLVLSKVFFDPPWRLTGLAETADGFVALAATFLAYGIVELVGGYGFLAVFVAAVTVRSSERRHSYHRVLHGFASQVEHVIVVALLVLLGGLVVRGGLDDVDGRVVVVAAVGILVVRPLAGRIALVGAPVLPEERRAIAFFGIRGIGSLYYVAYATQAADFAEARTIWATVLASVLLSIVVHGVAATPIMRRLDRRRAVAGDGRRWSDAGHVGQGGPLRRSHR